MTIETRLTNGKYPLPGKYPLRVINVIQENDKTVMLVEPDEMKPGEIVDRFLNLGDDNFVIINDCLIENENFLKGKLFAFTGDINNRLELSNALVINYHGEVRGTVSEKVNCLIVGKKPITAKVNRALSLGIPMISAEFLYEWLNLKREEAIKNHCRNAFGNFNTTHFSEAFTKAANQISQDFERIAIRSSVLRKAESIANVEGVAFVKVAPESCEVIKSSDIVLMFYRDSEPEASQAANPVGLHQSTGERPATAELNRFSNYAHNKAYNVLVPYPEKEQVNCATPTIDASYEKLISSFLDSEDMQAILKRMAFCDVPHKNILIEFEKQLKEASSKIGKDGVFVQALGRGVRLKPETLSYVFELKNDGSISVKDNGKEYHFPVWLSQLAIAYCGKLKQSTNHPHYQRYDLAIKTINNHTESHSEYHAIVSDFNRLIDFVHRSM